VRRGKTPLEGRARAALPHCRPFKLVDVMILVAASALGLAAMRPGRNQFHMFRANAKASPATQAYVGLARSCLAIILLDPAVGYVWIHLVPPRLPVPDLVRQPGVLVLILLIGLALICLTLSAVAPRVAPPSWVIALALGLSWAAGCLYHRSRAEPGWIEALGRFFAVCLTAAIAASYS
jgi:hypothetical protein